MLCATTTGGCREKKVKRDYLSSNGFRALWGERDAPTHVGFLTDTLRALKRTSIVCFYILTFQAKKKHAGRVKSLLSFEKQRMQSSPFVIIGLFIFLEVSKVRGSKGGEGALPPESTAKCPTERRPL